MRLAITGAGGRLGHALAAALATEHEPRLSDAPGQTLPAVDDAGAIKGDLREPEVARRVVEGCGAIVHLAAHPDAWPAGLADGEALDRCARGTFEVLRAAVAAGVPRVVLASTLELFEAYPPGWAVHEGWRPRPGTDIRELGPYVAELSAREIARAGWPLSVVCLRFGRLVTGREAENAAPDRRWLHVDDAVEAVRCALAYRPAGTGSRETSPGPPGWPVPEDRGWWVFHISGGGRARFPLGAAAHPSFGYTPGHDFGASPSVADQRTAYVDARGALTPVGRGAAGASAGSPGGRVAVFGASGPLASAVAPLLAPHHALRLTDVLSLEEGAARIAAHWPAAPRPVMLASPHEFRRADIADGAAVTAAAEGMDTLLNCTVVREQVAGAFRVNTLGAYHVMRAAVTHGIRRVVHTGPQILSHDHPAGYGADFGVPDEAPVRPGANVYFHSKYLGLEICRVFAEHHALEVAALLFSTFVNPAEPGEMRGRLGPATVSWTDAGLAIRHAVELPALPSPFEVLRILGDLPFQKFTNRKAKRVLGWAPRDSLLHLWQESDT